MALLFTASGSAAVTRGWVLPMNRRHVRSPRLYGCGQLVAVFALCWQAVFGLMISGSDVRPWGTLLVGALRGKRHSVRTNASEVSCSALYSSRSRISPRALPLLTKLLTTDERASC